MFHRLFAFSVALAVLALAGSGAVTCAVGAESAPCCCAPVTTTAVLGSAPTCCEVACGTRSSSSPTRAPEIASSENTLSLAPPVSHRVASVAPTAGSDLSVELERLAASIRRHDPPLLFVRNASFLI